MEYKAVLDRIRHYVDRKANFGQTVSVANAKRAVNYAYGVGKLAVVENIPELKWKDGDGADDSGEWAEYYCAKTPFGAYSIRYHYCDRSYSLLFCREEIVSNLVESKDAKQAANEDYKERLKKALGI
mgnify:CR=1 FL=1